VSDTKRWWEGCADRGLIGLAPEPWDLAHDAFAWPTAGFDSVLAGYDWEADARAPGNPFAWTGQTREEWLALADEMIRRWTAWRAHVASLPASLPPDRAEG
jgi:hypothetical protein